RTRPSGAAITVSDPFSKTVAPDRSAAARARFGLSPRSAGNRRSNSPSWGVNRTGPRMASNSAFGSPANTVSASASSRQGFAAASSARAFLRSRPLSPVPGPTRPRGGGPVGGAAWQPADGAGESPGWIGGIRERAPGGPQPRAHAGTGSARRARGGGAPPRH